jgi:hypothetical protein
MRRPAVEVGYFETRLSPRPRETFRSGAWAVGGDGRPLGGPGLGAEHPGLFLEPVDDGMEQVRGGGVLRVDVVVDFADGEPYLI